MAISNLYPQFTPKVPLTPASVYNNFNPKQPLAGDKNVYEDNSGKVETVAQQELSPDNVNKGDVSVVPPSISGQSIDTTTIHPKPTNNLGNLYK